MGNKLTKSSAILLTALSLSSAAAAIVPAVVPGAIVSANTVEAKNNVSTKAQSTATIKKNNDNVTGLFTFDTSVTTKPGKVAAGDYVEYTLRNLPAGVDLNNSDIKTTDGTVIGKFVIVQNGGGAAYYAQNNPKPNTDPAKQALDPTKQAYDSIVRVIFNDKAATLDNISYTFGYTANEYNPLAAIKDYTFTSEVQSGGKTLATVTNKHAKWGAVPKSDDIFVHKAARFTGNATATNMPGQIQVTQSVANRPFAVNEQIEVNLDDPALKFDLGKLKVGGKLSTVTGRNYYGDNANANGVILNVQQTPTYEIVSVTDKKIVVKNLIEVKPAAGAFLNLDVLVSPPANRISPDAKTIKDITFTVKNITRNSTNKQTFNASIYGSELKADGVKALRALTVKYVDTAGKDVAPQDNSNHTVGYNYSTSPKTVAGYKLKTTPANAKGTLNNDTTVTYVYDKEAVPTTTVKPTTPPTGGNTDPAANRNTTTTKAPTTTVAPTTSAPTTTEAPKTTTVAPKKIITSFKDPNGKDLVPPTDGDTPKRDIPGYTYVKTTVDPDGNVVHHYEPVKASTTVALTTAVAEKPLPKTGDAGSVIGLIGTSLAGLAGIVGFKRKK